MKYFVKTPFISQIIYPSLLWKIKSKEQDIFITFDDGPDPSTTPEILNLLAQYDAKATFFCTGKRAAKYRELLHEIQQAGHTLGNHTYNHLNGWKTSDSEYIEDVKKCLLYINSRLFRPPYGKIRFSQIRKLCNDYSIVLWTVLPGDFDPQVSADQCLKNAINYTKRGNIIVFHDNPKYFEKLMKVLPKFLEHFSNQGFRFKNIYL